MTPADYLAIAEANYQVAIDMLERDDTTDIDAIELAQAAALIGVLKLLTDFQRHPLVGGMT